MGMREPSVTIATAGFQPLGKKNRNLRADNNLKANRNLRTTGITVATGDPRPMGDQRS